MKTAKLSLGIVSIVLAMIILFQSCATGLGNALTNNTKDTSGSLGVFVAILFIAAGIVGIVARASKGGTIAATILYALAGIIGVASNGSFKDLMVWGVISLIITVVFAISIFKQNYTKAVPASTQTPKQ